MEDLEALELTNNKDKFRDWIYDKAMKYLIIKEDVEPDLINFKQHFLDAFTEGAFIVYELFKNDEV